MVTASVPTSAEKAFLFPRELDQVLEGSTVPVRSYFFLVESAAKNAQPFIRLLGMGYPSVSFPLAFSHVTTDWLSDPRLLGDSESFGCEHLLNCCSMAFAAGLVQRLGSPGSSEPLPRGTGF